MRCLGDQSKTRANEGERFCWTSSLSLLYAFKPKLRQFILCKSNEVQLFSANNHTDVSRLRLTFLLVHFGGGARPILGAGGSHSHVGLLAAMPASHFSVFAEMFVPFRCKKRVLYPARGVTLCRLTCHSV